MSLTQADSERAILRRAQSRAVMAMIGPLLDQWENLPNDIKGDLRAYSPDLCKYLDKISAAMEGSSAVNDVIKLMKNTLEEIRAYSTDNTSVWAAAEVLDRMIEDEGLSSTALALQERKTDV